MKLLRLLFNRVILGMVLFFALVALWEFQLKPQYRPAYDAGLTHYRNGDYQAALGEFEKAYAIAPNNADVVIMMGWTNLKLRRFFEAKGHFDRARTIDPKAEEARLGASFVALETGTGELDPAILDIVLKERSSDPDVLILAAGALQQQGRNLEAARYYRELLGDKSYGKTAQSALDEIFGLQGFSDPVPEGLAGLSKPAQLQYRHRTSGANLEARGRGGWNPFFVQGVNLAPAAPGFIPGVPPVQGDLYVSWLRQASDLNANVVRVYNLLPPAFYRAYRHYLKAGGQMKLYQQIWVGDPPSQDLFEPAFREAVRADIRHVVDAMHGRGDVPPKPGRTGGVYEYDFSADLAGFLLGSELEPEVVNQTNLLNAGKTSYSGKYVSASNAAATEVWFAEMLDYLVAYETDTYNWQHPVAIVNWPTLDALVHPTAARGIATLDESHFKAGDGLKAGIFAAYHVYPDFPDFMTTEAKYINARDAEGPNNFAGYLRDLRGRVPWPLVVAEYGVANSIGIGRFHPQGWNLGGHDEAQQAALLTRLTRSVRDTGCAGGLVYALADEWYKASWPASDLQSPFERGALWVSEMEPRKHFGLAGYRTSKWKLFAGDENAWRAETRLYSGGSSAADGVPRPESVQAAADEAYLYLRLNASCLDCPGPGRRPDGKADFDQYAFAFALNTVPKAAGARQLPLGGVSVDSGANFVFYLGGPANARLLVAENYVPYQKAANSAPNEPLITLRKGYAAGLVEQGPFVELPVPMARGRADDSRTVQARDRYTWSDLRFSETTPANPAFDPRAEWYVDLPRKAVFLRIPWSKLLITDPSSHQAFAGTDEDLHLRTMPTAGIEVSLLVLKAALAGGAPQTATVVASFPPLKGGKLNGPARFTWPAWETVKPEPFFKKAYYAIQKEYKDSSQPGSRPVAGAAGPGQPAGRDRVGTGR